MNSIALIIIGTMLMIAANVLVNLPMYTATRDEILNMTPDEYNGYARKRGLVKISVPIALTATALASFVTAIFI